jgi:hydrogenase maturation protein HypF
LVRKNVRSFATTSAGRLFDTMAAILGFIRPISFEGQAAIWLEQLARSSQAVDSYPFPFAGGELDYRPLLEAAIRDRAQGRDPAEIARVFQRGVSRGLRDAILSICASNNIDTVVFSGGVFQNELLLKDIAAMLGESVNIWTNHAVPPNDGGVSLGQAALAAFERFDESR